MGIRAGTVFHGTVGQPTAQVINGSLKVSEGASGQYLYRSGTSGNRRTWTWSGWIKRQQLVDKQTFMFAETDDSNQTSFGFAHSGADPVSGFYFRSEISGTTVNADLNAVLRDCSSFYHIVVSCDTTKKAADERVKVWINGKHQTWDTSPGMSENADLQINHNVQQELFSANQLADLDAYVSQVYMIDGLQLGPEYFGFIDPLTNTWRPKKFRAVGTTVNDGTDWSANFSGNGGTQPSTAFDGDGPRQDGYVHSGSALTVNFSPPLSGHIIVYGGTGAGSHNPTTTDTFTLSDGSVLSSQEKYDVAPYWTVMDFGEKKNITSLVCSGGYTLYAVEVDGVYLKDSTTETLDFGTNGFYLPLDNEDDFEKDKSGKGNNWTKSGFGGTSIDPDVVKNSPSGAVFGGRAQTGITTTGSAPANYATYNPLDMRASTALSNGNLTVTGAGAAWYLARSTQFLTTGKYYWEYKWHGGAVTESSGYQMGLKTPTSTLSAAAEQTGSFAFQYTTIYQTAGSNNSVVVSPGSTSANDVVMFAYDADAGLMWFGVNGTWNDNADPATGTNSDWTSLPTTGLAPFAGSYNTTIKVDANFGQKPFKYAPPQGFLPVNSATVRPNKVVPRSDQYVDIATYTGSITDTSSQTVTGLNFQSDLVWIKRRDNTNSHQLVDSVRGTGKWLESSSLEEENSTNTNGVLTSLNSNGFTLTGGSTNANLCCESGFTYVAWTWKAGGNKNTFNVDDEGYASASAAGITDGTIPLTGCSVGTKQGFSILKYAGSGSNGTIAHGLSQAPDFFFGRDLEDTGGSRDWIIYHSSIGNTGRLKFNQDGTSTSSTFFQDTSPTNSLITVGTSNDINSTNDHILYCWHNVPGLQKFGSYGGADAFVELGFRPALLIIKSLSSSRNWILIDTARDTFNPSNNALLPNDGAGEDDNTVYDIDFLSNGFKIRGSNGQIDGDTTYVYAAWAEAPAFNLYGAQSTAR